MPVQMQNVEEGEMDPKLTKMQFDLQIRKRMQLLHRLYHARLKEVHLNAEQ